MHPPANIVLVEIVNIGVMEIVNGILQFKNVLTKVLNLFVEFSKISGKTSAEGITGADDNGCG